MSEARRSELAHDDRGPRRPVPVAARLPYMQPASRWQPNASWPPGPPHVPEHQGTAWSSTSGAAPDARPGARNSIRRL